MKHIKILLGLFFLLDFFSSSVAFAQEPALEVSPEYNAANLISNLPLSDFFTFDFEGGYIFAEKSGNFQKIVKIAPNGEQKVLVEKVSQPLLGLSFYKGELYGVFRGRIAVLRKGSFKDILTGLPAWGDNPNGSVIFNEGKMYFAVGTATNSGIVGPDNSWLGKAPSIHDLPCRTFEINRLDVETENVLTKKDGDKAVTGPFMPFNTRTYSDTVAASIKCNGAIFRANPDGSALEIYADGLHNVKGMSFDSKGNLYALDSAIEDRGIRPLKNGKDGLFAIKKGEWYGWPDFSAGIQLENPLILGHPNSAVKPNAVFDQGLYKEFLISDFAQHEGIAIASERKISEFGLDGSNVRDVASLNEGSKINQVKFGPDGHLYVLTSDGKHSEFWKIESTRGEVTILGGVSKERQIPLAWSISMSVMLTGFLAAYLVVKNRQQTI